MLNWHSSSTLHCRLQLFQTSTYQKFVTVQLSKHKTTPECSASFLCCKLRQSTILSARRT